jgi:glucose/arabinose dehydrogenase
VGGYLVLSSIIGTTSQIQFYRFGGNPEDAYVLAGVLTIQFTSDWSHQSPGSALRPIPGQPDRFDLFVNVGSRTNNTASPDVTVSGLSLPSTMVPADSILRFELDLSGAAPIVSSPVQAVKGIRNSLAMGFHPQTGDFYFADNGIDGLVDINEPFSTDELNRVLAGDLLKSIPDFGFPNAYVPYRTGGTVGGGVQPFVAFQPLGNPFTGSESEGPASLAFTPPGFPLALQSGVFVGFHGRGGLKGLANEENPVVFVNLSTGQYYHFLSNDDPNIRHPDSLYAFGDSLFIADIGGPAGDGAIYQITYIAPEPGTIIGTGAALLALAAWRRRSL